MSLGFRMHAERTPNPDSIKWVLGEPLLPPGRSASFDAPPEPSVSPLAARLFGIDGVVRVFLGRNFVTVTKRPEVEWMSIAQDIVDALKEHAASGAPALSDEYEPPRREGEGEVEARIREILEEEIRPAVAMDGGDVSFVGFRDGVVEVHLEGACAGCPSSTATLKFGIEARLREEIPEVTEVVAL